MFSVLVHREKTFQGRRQRRTPTTRFSARPPGFAPPPAPGLRALAFAFAVFPPENSPFPPRPKAFQLLLRSQPLPRLRSALQVAQKPSQRRGRSETPTAAGTTHLPRRGTIRTSTTADLEVEEPRTSPTQLLGIPRSKIDLEWTRNSIRCGHRRHRDRDRPRGQSPRAASARFPRPPPLPQSSLRPRPPVSLAGPVLRRPPRAPARPVDSRDRRGLEQRRPLSGRSSKRCICSASASQRREDARARGGALRRATENVPLGSLPEDAARRGRRPSSATAVGSGQKRYRRDAARRTRRAEQRAQVTRDARGGGGEDRGGVRDALTAFARTRRGRG